MLWDCVDMFGELLMDQFTRHPGVHNGMGFSLHLWLSTFLYCLVCYLLDVIAVLPILPRSTKPWPKVPSVHDVDWPVLEQCGEVAESCNHHLSLRQQGVLCNKTLRIQARGIGS
jgi:hypothetical protein